jgi:anti-sigma B factor antagonist
VYHGAERAVRIQRNTIGNVTVVAFSGEFDAMDLPAVDAEMEGIIQEGCTRLVFNLRDLTFINSTWISYLVKTNRDLKAREGELVLSEQSRFFQRVGKALGIDRVFTIVPDDQAALEHFGEDGGAN